MSRQARHLRCPETVLGWIPWYVEGSLTPRQMGAVEAHAAECADCRSEIDMISGAPFEIDIELPDPERTFAELSARIAAEGGADLESDTPPVVSSDFAHPSTDGNADASGIRSDWAAVADWVFDEEAAAEYAETETEAGQVIQGPWMRSNLWAAAAAVMLLAAGGLLGSTISTMNSDPGTEAVYETASAPGVTNALSASVDNSPRIDIVFQPTATAAEISSALREVGVEVVAGPTQLGVYRVRIAASASDGRDVSRVDAEAAVAQLKAAPGAVVIFAERVP